MIAIIDYGVGNLFSLSSSLRYLGLENKLTGDAEEVRRADRIILPGVGAFADAAEKLRKTGLDKIVKEQAGFGKPLLGICLGMQLLFEKSYEYGEHSGLGLIPGKVCPLEEDLTQPLKVPHIGWNSLHFADCGHPLLKYNKEGDYVYYVHSYYAKNCRESVLAWSEYEVEVPGLVGSENVFGSQFHPEKSGQAGLNLLRAFSEI